MTTATGKMALDEAVTRGPEVGNVTESSGNAPLTRGSEVGNVTESSGNAPLANGVACAVTAVCFVEEKDLSCICAGVGPTLRTFPFTRNSFLPSASTGLTPVLEARVLPVSIHGIECTSVDPVGKSLLIWGNRFLSLSEPVRTFASPSTPSKCRLVRTCRSFPDWILGARFVSDQAVTVVTLAQGTVHVVDATSLETRAVISCSGTELFWSMALRVSSALNRDCDSSEVKLRVAGGTSFGQLVLWRIPGRSLFGESLKVGEDARIDAHDGPVMHIIFSSDRDAKWVASASVDRTVRVWRWDDENDVPLFPCARFYGHTARVWQVAFFRDPTCRDDGILPPRLLSVGEDKTMRVWPKIGEFSGRDKGEPGSGNAPGGCLGADHNQHPPNVYSGHAGRNVWCVDVICDGSASGRVNVATGGGDGIVQLRALEPDSLEFDSESSQSAPDTSGRRRLSDGVDGSFPSLETRPGVAAESVQSIVTESHSKVYISTSYGRLLSADIANDGSVAAWNVLYSHDDRSMVFAPSALVLVQDTLLAGTTDGRVVVLDTTHWKWSSFVAIESEPRLICGVFGDISCEPSSSDAGGFMDVFVGTLAGSLLHFSLERCLIGSSDCAAFICSYSEPRSVRHGQVSSVHVLPSALGVLVGDRRGYLNMYRHGRYRGSDNNAGNSPVSYPVSFCRPHKDRLSSIVSASLVRISYGNGGKRHMTVAVLTVGFDGRVVEVHVSSLPASDDECTSASTLSIVSTVKCAERLDTLIHVACRAPISDCLEGALESCNPVVVGFRSAQLVVWDVLQRNLLLRANVGGWRRAMGLHVKVQDDFGPRDSRNPWIVAFWRSRVFRVVASTPSNASSLGIGFHGLRAHAVATVSDGTDSPGVSVLSASEDTTVRVTRVTPSGWNVGQVLSGHVSGANCIACLDLAPIDGEGFAIALSGGGMNEMILWKRPKRGAAWAATHVHSPPAPSDRRNPQHRVMSVALQVARGCGSACESEISVMAYALAGRSDGSVTLSKVIYDKRTGKLSIVDIHANSSDHSGAVLSADWDKRFACAVTGDSSGKVIMWKATSSGEDGSCYESLNFLGDEQGVHTAGVNDVSCQVLSQNGQTVIVSAGDDEKVITRRVTGEGDFGEAHVVAQLSAAAVGVAIVGTWTFVAVGADQTVTRGSLESSTPGVGNELVRKTTSVADPGGLCVLRVFDLDRDGEAKVQLAVVGAGLEVLSI